MGRIWKCRDGREVHSRANGTTKTKTWKSNTQRILQSEEFDAYGLCSILYIHTIFLLCPCSWKTAFFYTVVWVENKNVTDTSSGDLYSASFFFWTQEKILLFHNPCSQAGPSDQFRPMHSVQKWCQFLARKIASAVISSTFSLATSTEKVVFSK